MEKPSFKWYCLVSDECKAKNEAISLGATLSSTNVVKHLAKHGIRSERTLSMQATKRKRDSDAAELVGSIMFTEDETLASEYACTMMVIKSMLPHCLVESEGFRIFSIVACKATMNRRMHASLVVQCIVEIYHSIKVNMKEIIKREVQNSPIPILHLSVDEWCCKLLRQRFIVVRIHFGNSEFEQKSFLLSLRHFDRSSVDRNLQTASNVLYDWVRSVLREFGIEKNHIYSATTYAGNDIRFMCETLMGVQWEWCIPHMLTNAVNEGCGMMSSQRNDKHEVKSIISTTSRIISRIHGSKVLSAAFDNLVFLKFGKRLVLKRYISMRFTGVFTTLERILKLWSYLTMLYNTQIGDSFPLQGKYEVIEQLVALFRGIKRIQKHAETLQYPVACTTLVMLLSFERKELQLTSNITLANGTVVPYQAIKEEVQATRRQLKEALNRRFLNRYITDGDCSRGRGAGKPAEFYLWEMATVMHPSYESLSFLNYALKQKVNPDYSFFSDEMVARFCNGIHEKVISLAYRVYAGLKDQGPPPLSELHMELECPIHPVDSIADQFSNSSMAESGNHEVIKKEFFQYMTEKGDRQRDSQKKILEWWKAKAFSYPHLSKVAQCLLGIQPSSSAVEVDNGIGGHYLEKNQLSTATQVVEMKLFVKRNEKLIYS